MDEYKLLDSSGNTIAMGNRDQVFRFVKHHVPDGRYRIVGPEIKLHVVREKGIVGPDPDGVCLERSDVELKFLDTLESM